MAIQDGSCQAIHARVSPLREVVGSEVGHTDLYGRTLLEPGALTKE